MDEQERQYVLVEVGLGWFPVAFENQAEPSSFPTGPLWYWTELEIRIIIPRSLYVMVNQ